MNRDVFLLILAMDAYQRGYTPGIAGLQTPTFGYYGNATSVVKIGNATITRDSSSLVRDNLRLDQPAGFYAVSYDWNGTKVISYRGTDFDIPLGTQAIRDILFGWSSFTGIGSTSQFTLAQDFYEAATPNELSPGNRAGATNIITTGHSLGRALADNDDDIMPAAFAA